MNHQNLLLQDDPFAPAASDSLEHLPSHHCAAMPDCGACPGDGSICKTSCRVAEESPPFAASNDIKTRLREHLTMSKFAKAGDLYGEMNTQRFDAADRIEALERQLAEASKKAAMYEHVRTMNPREFMELWTENLCGFETFDDLILADMEKRKLA